MDFNGYRFVAAANLFQNYGGLTIYVKYKKTKSNEITIKRVDKNYIWYDCPDREFVFVRDSFNDDAFYPNESFDLCLDLNTFRDDLGAGIGIDYFMTNFTHNNSEAINRDSLPASAKKVQILSDSGGLQLAREVAGLIHPKDLVEFYNKNVDAGMVLDIPLWIKDDKIAKRAALLQRKNNEVMLKNGRKGLELINIFHGGSVEDRKKYRDIVEDERIPRVAIGGLLLQKPLTGVNTLYEIIEGGSYRYKQYHALGVFDMSYLALLVKIANSGDNPPHITSDSTSHIQASLNNVYHIQMNEQHIMSRQAYGTKAGSISNPALHLNCSCPVCGAIKYRDIFAFGHNRFNGFLALHNAIQMARYTQSLQEACRHLTPHEYNKYVILQLKNIKNKADVKLALDYIDVVTQHGLKEAQKKYARHINNWRQSDDIPQSLFDTTSTSEKSSQKELYERTSNLLASLENQLK
jgi:hypothetical protein